MYPRHFCSRSRSPWQNATTTLFSGRSAAQTRCVPPAPLRSLQYTLPAPPSPPPERRIRATLLERCARGRKDPERKNTKGGSGKRAAGRPLDPPSPELEELGERHAPQRPSCCAPRCCTPRRAPAALLPLARPGTLVLPPAARDARCISHTRLATQNNRPVASRRAHTASRRPALFRLPTRARHCRSPGTSSAASGEMASINDFDDDRDQIYVSGLPKDVTEQELADYFGQIGTIRIDKKKKAPKVSTRGEAWGRRAEARATAGATAGTGCDASSGRRRRLALPPLGPDALIVGVSSLSRCGSIATRRRAISRAMRR